MFTAFDNRCINAQNEMKSLTIGYSVTLVALRLGCWNAHTRGDRMQLLDNVTR